MVTWLYAGALIGIVYLMSAVVMKIIKHLNGDK